MLDYHCYPVWLYDEDGYVVDTLLPEELRDDAELDAKFDDLQARYDALYVDNEHEFYFKGFNSEEDKQQFLEDWRLAILELQEKSKGKYEIVDDIKMQF